jgi:hypothetical protein
MHAEFEFEKLGMLQRQRQFAKSPWSFGDF